MSGDGEVWSILLAAGGGRRFGSLKQFERLGTRRLVDHVVDTASAVCDGVVVVVPQGVVWEGGSERAVEGGSTRAASVRKGLSAVPPEADVIVVHDAAHPLASAALFRGVIHAVRAGADAAIPALALTEPIKRVDAGCVIANVPRKDLVLVQTPHAFRADLLRSLHAARPEVIEESELIEEAGGRIAVVPGEPLNLHVTTRDELAIARRLVGLVDERFMHQ